LSPMSEGNMTNPFEDENGTYHVLINEEGQHSLWPSFVEVPNGWTIILKSDSRAACLEFINRNWTDMRPRSLIEAMDGVADGQQSRENQNGASAGSSTQGLDKRS
jgi:MbtH protein